MAIKEELEKDIKKDGGGKDELDALDALEKEAKEYDKVKPQIVPYTPPSQTEHRFPRMLRSTASSKPSN